jgi:glycerophosphoryl diester phosphodiesterase
MKLRSLVLVLGAAISGTAFAQMHAPQLFCHRTANKDVPENTLESLEQAALLGCDVIEIDVRRTLDGVLVLNHDGFLERLTDGEGEVETTLYGDLALRDAGSWMGERWRGLHITRFDDALRMAHDRNIQLILDIKTKGIGPDVLKILDREGMRQQVRFGGEWDDIKRLDPLANKGQEAKWLQPGATAQQVAELRRQGSRVIVNFSANTHEMDLAAMKAAVAAGADGINVDYPRLGADAVGRPVEQRIAALAEATRAGSAADRIRALNELSKYHGFELAPHFQRALLDLEDGVSRAGALALVSMRPRPKKELFLTALHESNAVARANAAWALGVLQAPASAVTPLLRDSDPHVLQETLLALSHMPGLVPASVMTPLLQFPDTRVRGSAAVALVAHQPALAATLVPRQLAAEVKETLRLYAEWDRRGKPSLSQAEIKTITDRYRYEMKMLQAINQLHGAVPMRVLEEHGFHPGEDFTQIHALVGAFNLWDRIGEDPASAVVHLASADAGVADRAEWMLVQAEERVSPLVRAALSSPDRKARTRAIRIVAFRGDVAALPALRAMKGQPEASWAVEKIVTLHPEAQ